MGLTLLAILTGALLLPGILATYFFYRAGRTPEADPVLPPLNSPVGLSLVGAFAILVHFLYALGLWAVGRMPACCGLPLADPYRLLHSGPVGLNSSAEQLSLFAGLLLLLVLAALVGHIAGQFADATGDRAIFHGPLNPILAEGEGPNAFITAYVLTKIVHEDKVLGYEGTVTALTRDAERLPARVVLKDARPFHITITKSGARREEDGTVMQWLTISAEDWHNIAFRVYQVID